ncbi:uncharacterized protein BCR38DRAFT_511779 [Pseudomassariella vexata]|uniref:Uncharacterized protein n=1 Tax=Pseudomassariella vexata TaxID=1141098 RepID=A0A1Y2E3E5_9PEZI|nr:uncharacterized protein BCR38DRAFT_511779 [Pseudomassariella vexata]ORY66081.1 hypothetical protein BCR38DRAFT_511779 [Pseudomassariella vexata]
MWVGTTTVFMQSNIGLELRVEQSSNTTMVYQATRCGGASHSRRYQSENECLLPIAAIRITEPRSSPVASETGQSTTIRGRKEEVPSRQERLLRPRGPVKGEHEDTDICHIVENGTVTGFQVQSEGRECSSETSCQSPGTTAIATITAARYHRSW